jgi:hypothetical protein
MFVTEVPSPTTLAAAASDSRITFGQVSSAAKDYIIESRPSSTAEIMTAQVS